MALDTAAALKQPGPLVAAWSGPESDGVRLSIFSVAGNRASQLSIETVPFDAVSARRADMESTGVLSGAFEPQVERVWTSDANRFRAWSSRGIELDGDKLAFSDVQRIVVTTDAERVERTIEAELQDGTRRALVQDYSMLAEDYMQYSADDLLFDSAWAVALGQDLAEWLHVPFEDRRFK